MNTLTTDLQSIVKAKINAGVSDITIRILLKERLQDYALGFIYNHPVYSKLVFYGGTCLRKIYDMNRLSENLDFENEQNVPLENLARDAKTYFVNKLGLHGTDPGIQEIRDIFRVTLKFAVLYDLGLSPNRQEKLHIKLEINQKTTGKYKVEVTPYTKSNVSVLLRHYSLKTSMSGKIVAALERVYQKGNTGILIKGRDYYDLIWYMQKGVMPDQKKLKDINSSYSTKKVFEILDKKVDLIKPSDLIIDLEPLFEEKKFIKDWCKNFHDMYKKYRAKYD